MLPTYESLIYKYVYVVFVRGLCDNDFFVLSLREIANIMQRAESLC